MKTISDVIKDLEILKKDVGDLPIQVESQVGGWHEFRTRIDNLRSSRNVETNLRIVVIEGFSQK